MKVDDLSEAVALAKRFIKEADQCKRSTIHAYVESGAQAAATKRASMDLTRALAKLRRPN